MRAVTLSPAEMHRLMDRRRRQLQELQLPSWPIFAPVDNAYPAWLHRWSTSTETLHFTFAAGARRGLPRVSVENWPVGTPSSNPHRPAPQIKDTEPGTVFVDGVAQPARVHHQAGDRIYALDLNGTSVRIAANGHRAPRRIELHRVTDLEPYRRRTLEMIHQDPDGSREWQNPDAWENPPDTTAPLWAHLGLLHYSATQIQVTRDLMSRRPAQWPPAAGPHVHDGGHWWAAAQHEQQRLTAVTQAEANDTVNDTVQLVSLLCAHATWWQHDELRDRAIREIAMYRTSSNTAVASTVAQRVWAEHPSQGIGATPAPGSGSDLVLTAWQHWADHAL